MGRRQPRSSRVPAPPTLTNCLCHPNPRSISRLENTSERKPAAIKPRSQQASRPSRTIKGHAGNSRTLVCQRAPSCACTENATKDNRRWPSTLCAPKPTRAHPMRREQQFGTTVVMAGAVRPPSWAESGKALRIVVENGHSMQAFLMDNPQFSTYLDLLHSLRNTVSTRISPLTSEEISTSESVQTRHPARLKNGQAAFKPG